MIALFRFSCPSDLRDLRLNVRKEGEGKGGGEATSRLRDNGMANSGDAGIQLDNELLLQQVMNVITDT